MEGNLKKLYKINFINYIPLKFVKIIENMYFQLDKIDMSIIQKEAELAILYSLAARTNNKVMKFNADSLSLELENKKKEMGKNKSAKLNDFLNYIEISLNYGSIDPEKMKASRAFSLYNLALEKNNSKDGRN
jgi:hypothetical protein